MSNDDKVTDRSQLRDKRSISLTSNLLKGKVGDDANHYERPRSSCDIDACVRNHEQKQDQDHKQWIIDFRSRCGDQRDGIRRVNEHFVRIKKNDPDVDGSANQIYNGNLENTRIISNSYNDTSFSNPNPNTENESSKNSDQILRISMNSGFETCHLQLKGNSIENTSLSKISKKQEKGKLRIALLQGKIRISSPKTTRSVLDAEDFVKSVKAGTIEASYNPESYRPIDSQPDAGSFRVHQIPTKLLKAITTQDIAAVWPMLKFEIGRKIWGKNSNYHLNYKCCA